MISNIRRTLLKLETVDHSDVVGASPVRAAPNTSSLSTSRLASTDWANTNAKRDYFYAWLRGIAFVCTCRLNTYEYKKGLGSQQNE